MRARRELIHLYQEMLWIRMVEEAIAHRYQEQKMRCPVHLSIGQEGAAVALCSALSPQDQVFSNHRCHAHYLAKGGNLEAMLCELHGRQGGCCEGRGGSMHLFDTQAGVASSIPIVGASIPHAVGWALANKQQSTQGCAVSFLGDGAAEEGVFHESLNFASTHGLGVLFVIENNLYSIYTNLQERQPELPLTRFAQAHGIPYEQVDASRVELAHKAALRMLDIVDSGKGPACLLLDTYRFHAHCGPERDDDLGYRPPSELQSALSHCPLELAKQQITELGAWSDAKEAQLRERYTHKIETAFAQALAAPFPSAPIEASEVYATKRATAISST